MHRFFIVEWMDAKIGDPTPYAGFRSAPEGGPFETLEEARARLRQLRVQYDPARSFELWQDSPRQVIDAAIP